jgi:hypothetical protein
MAGQWFYTVNRQQQGPVSWEQLYRLAERGELHPGDMVWQEGMPNWVKAKTTPGLFGDAGDTRGRRALDNDDDRRPSRLDDDDQPHRARSDRDDENEEGDRPRRRRRKEGGMPVGLKVGLIVGGVVVGLLIVGVILILVLQPGDSDRGLFEVPVGGSVVKTGTLTSRDGRDPKRGITCHIYEVKFVANRAYTIDLESNAFDAFLRLENSNRQELAWNDDFIGLNSRIVYVAPNTGTYRIIATSLNGGFGRYTLRVREGNMFK